FFSRLNNGDHQLKANNSFLVELIEDAFVSLKGKAKDKDIALTYSDQTDGRELYAERKLILDALSRLTDNAIKFSPQGAEVKLSALLLADGSAVLAVRDNGPGIAMHTLERCMKPFAQADEALTRSEQGLGLGLAISKLIAEMHGGKLVVDGKPDIGTTASIWMPAKNVLIERAQRAG
ncbi:MAG: sensor histidine kinase, partial [Aestuariivirgaceae bacterium]